MQLCLRLTSLDPELQNNSMPQGIPDGLTLLLTSLNWSNVDDWWRRWEHVGGVNLARHQWSVPVLDSWIAFVGLPLLSRVESALLQGERVVLGVSALPGCLNIGKKAGRSRPHALTNHFATEEGIDSEASVLDPR